MFLRKLRIKTKFYIIISLLVIAFIISGAVTAIMISQIMNYGNVASEFSKLNFKFNNMKFAEYEFLVEYKNDVDFFATGKNKNLEVFSNEYSDAIKVVTNARETQKALRFVSIAELNSIENSLNIFKEKFDELVLKIRERGIDNYGLKARVDEALDELYELNNDEKINEYLDILAENQTQYIKTKDKISYNRFLENFEELRVYLVGDEELYEELDFETASDSIANDSIPNNSNLETTEQIAADTTNTQLTDSLNAANNAINSSLADKEFFDKLQEYMDYFVLLVSIDREIGSDNDKGLFGIINSEKQRLEKSMDKITGDIMNVISQIVFYRIVAILIIMLVLIILVSFIILTISNSILAPINNIKKHVKTLSSGQLPENKINVTANDEISDIEKILNRYIDGLSETTAFAQAIGKNDFNTEYTPLSSKDVLGNSLLEMRNSLKMAKEEEEKRKEADEKQNWITQGISKFNDILRQNNDDVEELAYQIISNLVDYMKANQGGIFLSNDDDDEEHFLEMVAAYAYDRRKYIDKKVNFGEGLVGTCALERKTVYLTKIPNEYIRITSGLGQSNPRALILVPLLMEEQVMGVLEIASFNTFEKHEIEFIEKVGETIASTLASVKINARTNALLEESKLKSEAMAAQEEEMRQNMEELQATQEEMMRKQNEVETAYEKLKSNEDTMRKALENNKKVEEELRRKNKEAKEKEKEMKKNIDELKSIKTSMEKKQTELEIANKKAHSNEEILKKALERAKQKEHDIKEIQQKVSEYESRINELNQKQDATKELLKFKDEEIKRLKGE